MTYFPFRRRIARSVSTTPATRLADRLIGPAFFDVAKPRRRDRGGGGGAGKKRRTDPPIREPIRDHRGRGGFAPRDKSGTDQRRGTLAIGGGGGGEEVA